MAVVNPVKRDLGARLVKELSLEIKGLRIVGVRCLSHGGRMMSEGGVIMPHDPAFVELLENNKVTLLARYADALMPLVPITDAKEEDLAALLEQEFQEAQLVAAAKEKEAKKASEQAQEARLAALRGKSAPAPVEAPSEPLEAPGDDSPEEEKTTSRRGAKK